jgi:hypothetical protein
MDQILFEAITKLVDYIPINCRFPSNGRLADGMTIDSEFPVKQQGVSDSGSGNIAASMLGLQEDSISFRNIVKALSLLIKDASWEALVIKQRHSQLMEFGCTYPAQYLLFDFCLAALDQDYVDARLYLAHSFHILGLHKPLNLLLSVIVNEEEQKLLQDNDIRKFLNLLARATQPRNANLYLDTYGKEFSRRYKQYTEEFKNS